MKGYSQLGLLLRLSRFRRYCEKLPELEIPEHVLRVIENKKLNQHYGNDQRKRAQRAIRIENKKIRESKEEN